MRKTKRENMRKLCVLLLSISMTLSLLCSCTSYDYDKTYPSVSNSSYDDESPLRATYFNSEDEINLFLELITKNAEELAEYDILNILTPEEAANYEIELYPGKVFVLPAPQYSIPISMESIKNTQKTMESLGYFTAEDTSVISKFEHKFYMDYPDIDLISVTTLSTGNETYVFSLRKNTTNSTTKYLFPYYWAYKKLKFGEDNVTFYQERHDRNFKIKGSLFFGKNNEFVVDIQITTKTEQTAEKINLDQFVWKDYYEEEVKFDD